jgi:hypothetical protein
LFVLCTAALVLPVSTIAGAAVFTFTRLASTNNSSKYGEPVIFIADVLWEGSASTPTGTVTFTDGTKVLGNVSLDSNCRAALTSSSLAAGSHSIVATYVPADPLLFSGSSTSFTQNVASTTATTTLASTPNPSTFGQPVTFAATVKGNGGTPTGTVTFTDGANTLGTASLDNSGQATFTTSTLTVGGHAITANHGGDPNFLGSRNMLTQTVNPNTPPAAETYRAVPSHLWTRAQHRANRAVEVLHLWTRAQHRANRAVEVRDRPR